MPRPPLEYERFFYARLFWRELGRHYHEMTYAEVEETKVFMKLEQEHPQRFSKEQK